MTASSSLREFSPQEKSIADSAISLIVSQGFDNVSVRKVATASGVAPGTVQYFMGTKEQLLIKALQRSAQRQVERIELMELPQNLTPRERLTLILRELLPIGEVQREDAALWIVMSAAASTRKALAATYLELLKGFQAEVTTSVQNHLQAPSTPASSDTTVEITLVEQTARLITALVNGLTVDYINIPLSKDSAEALSSDLSEGLKRILA
ncbi:TetR/AcrR family transcriptional regulator [Rothia nasisuis]|uniref:TetR/AcrR family transcriptional regulator n=1 Tax=Rothia nasisuis TaxID=2109647 RepID=UPI001F18B341|nr:TetR/AcrR family transcriptional regulator [Rothia nasisuis]